MSDIVERLRSEGSPLSMEAAARMETLEFALTRERNNAIKIGVFARQRIHDLIEALELIRFRSSDDVAIQIAKEALDPSSPPEASH